MKNAIIIVCLASFCLACSSNEIAETTAEPADPDTYDMSVWETVEPGIHSGFGSTDVSYSKSIPPEGSVEESINLQGWKGERVSCKLVVWSNGSNENISIKTKGFSKADYTFDKNSTSISVVKYVLTDQFLNENSGACGPRDNDNVPVHLTPDIISNESSFSIDAKGTRPVWISVDIPENAPAGIYTASISIKSKSGTKNHDITLEVLNKKLPPPSEWAFHLDLWQNPFAVARFHNVELWGKKHLELLRSYLTMLADAGQKCITATLIDKPWGDNKPCYDDFGSMISWTKKSNGKWEYDYSIFDQYVSLAMECGIKKQINCYSMVPINNKFSWYDEAASETVVQELFPGTKNYEDLWQGFLIDFRVHLMEKDWLDITRIALDEREEEEMTNMFSFLAETAPEFKIAMAGFYHENINLSIYDFSSNWRDNGRIPAEAIKTRKDAGLITTYYVACGIPKPNNFTFSPPSESCVEGWIAAAMGFNGFLRWAYNSWPENPMIDSRYTKWPAGDTYFIYPGPLSSVRFERLREGIQDYEKIRIIRKELAQNNSPEATAARIRLDEFLCTIDSKTLDDKSAAEVISEGKQLINEIVKSTRIYTLAEKNIQHARENLSEQIYTEDPELTRQVHNLYIDCLFDKLWEPALPGLPYKWFSITGAGDQSYGKCQLQWDPMFVLNAWAPLDDNELIHDVFRNYWNVIDNNPEAPKGSYRYGMVPCVTNPDLPQPGYSQIPILAWGCLMIFNQTNDLELLDLCLPYLDAFLTWYATERDVDNDGLIEYGAYKRVSIGDMVQTARFETFDFHATLDNLKLTKHPTRGTGGEWYGNIEGVDQTCFLAISERAMIEMCQRTGRIEMMKKYQRNLTKRTKAIRAKMWDPETKFFYSLDRDTDNKILIRTLQGFLALTAGLASEKQAEELVKQLTDPSLFWSKYPVTTSSMDEPTFDPNGFWRGDMWPPTNYLIALGLNRYGYYDIAIELAEKMQELLGKYDGHAYERYNGVTGDSLGVKDYCWGVAAWSIAVNTIYGIQEDYRTIVVPSHAKGRRLKLGKLEVNYPTDTSVELNTSFEREFRVVFQTQVDKIEVQCNGKTIKSISTSAAASEVMFTAMPGKTYVVSKGKID